MKPHHVAALALVGWYLMGAPRISESPLRFDLTAPLTKWNQYDSYDSAADCAAAKTKMLAPILKLADSQTGTEKQATMRDLMSAITALKCIGTDDPRLKGN